MVSAGRRIVMGLVFSDVAFLGAPGPFFFVLCEVLFMIISFS